MGVGVMGEGTCGKGGRIQEGIQNNSLLYADDGMIALLEAGWLLGLFSNLLGLFERVGWQVNVGKMVGMVFRLFQVAGTQSETA